MSKVNWTIDEPLLRQMFVSLNADMAAVICYHYYSYYRYLELERYQEMINNVFSSFELSHKKIANFHLVYIHFEAK